MEDGVRSALGESLVVKGRRKEEKKEREKHAVLVSYFNKSEEI